jgi:hypothetical protein
LLHFLLYGISYYQSINNFANKTNNIEIMIKQFTLLFALALASIFVFSQNNISELSTGPIPKNSNKGNQNTMQARNFVLTGAVVYGVENFDTRFSSFTVDAPEIIVPEVDLGTEDDFVNAVERVNGSDSLFYVLTTSGKFYLADIDLDTNTLLGEISADSGAAFSSPTGMAIDPTSGDYYVITESGELFTLNPQALSVNLVGVTTIDLPIALAIDGDGELYTYSISTDNLYAIDKLTAQITLIGDIGFDANFGQGMAWNADEDVIYMSAFNSWVFQCELRSVNKTTGATTFLGAIGDPGETQFGGICFNGDFIEPGPEAVISIVPDSLSAEIYAGNSITLTTTIFNTGDDSLQFAFDDPESFIISITPDSGTIVPADSLEITFEYSALNLEAGEYDVTLRCVNNSGNEPLYNTYHQLSVSNIFLGGTVYAGTDNPIDQGFAYNYKMEGDVFVDIDAYLIDTAGSYSFYPTPMAEYIVKAEPTPTSVYFGNYLPTYFGNVLFWEDATRIMPTDSIFGANIQLIENNMSNNGSGKISGNIYYADVIRDELQPAKDIQIIISDLLSLDAGMVMSDEEGYFEFSNLDDGSYELAAEIFGKSSEKLNLEIDQGHQEQNGIVLIIHDDNIVLSSNDKLPALFNSVSNTFPNPASDHASILLDTKESTRLNISIRNQLGQEVSRTRFEAITGSQIINLDINQLVPGYYLVSISDDSNNAITRKLIKN